MKNKLKRLNCVVCGGELKHIASFKDFPIYMGASVDSKKETSDMNWGSCAVCGCVQLEELIKPEILYRQPHNPSIGKVWEEHNNQFSDLISRYQNNNILEIGGANLKIANLISKKTEFISYDIIDYSSNEYSITRINEKINLIKSSAEEYALKNKVDCIILSHTFEHLYEPTGLLLKLNQCLEDTGRIFISVPNIKNQLIDGFLNALNFEHTFLIDDEYMEIIANQAGFCVKAITKFSKYNSFYVLEKNIKKQNLSIKHSSPQDAKTIFLSFIDKIQNDVQSINQKIGEEKIYVFGAHIFTQFLLNFGLKEENIIYVLDNDVSKNEKYLFGTRVKVKNPDILRTVENPVVVVRAAQYREEIVSQLNSINDYIKYI